MVPILSSRMAITPHWWQVGGRRNSRSRGLLESFLEWCSRGGRERPKITMAKTLAERQTLLGCPSGVSRLPALSPVHGLSGNVYLGGVPARPHGDSLIRTCLVPFWQGSVPLLDIERQKSSTTAGSDSGRIPTLGPGYQLRGAPRTKSRN